MFESAVVEDHVHHYLQAFGVRLVTQAAVLFVGAEAWVYTVIVGRSVAMIRALAVIVGRVVLENGRKPQGRNAQFGEVVEVLTYAFKVATVAKTWLRTVGLVCVKALDVVVFRVAVSKTVGHKHVEHVGIGESHALLATLLARLELVFHLLCRLPVLEVKGHLAGLRAFKIEVNEQVIGAVKPHNAVHLDAGIVSSDLCRTYAFAVNHELQRRILHADKPVCRVNAVYLDRRVGCHNA